MQVTEQNLPYEAVRLLKELTPGTEASVVALYGDLGAGKTVFAKALASALGVTETVTSPTFVIEKIYKLEHQQFKRLIHIDAYRLSGSAELAAIGWHEIIRDPQNLIVVEWADIIEDALPTVAIKIRFTVSGDTTRTLTYGG